MNLYYLSQNQNNGYDTYDAMVVAAPDEDTARRINPYDHYKWNEEKNEWGYYDRNDQWRGQGAYAAWANHIDGVTVELLGVATPGSTQGVVLSSFNAG